MIEITEVIKKSKIYTIRVNQEVMDIEPEVVLKYRIKPMMSMDDKTFQALINDQNYYHYLKKGLKKLSRMMTSFEMKSYLIDQACPMPVIKQIIMHFESKSYLNDQVYVKNYIEFKKNSDGPKLLRFKLLEKGILNELIDQAFKNYDEEAILMEIIPTKVKSIKKESIRQMNAKLRAYFMNKGFTLDIVDHVISKTIDWTIYDDKDVILKEFNKIYKQYQKKLEGYELKKKIYEKLYQKGYQKARIDDVLRHMD